MTKNHYRIELLISFIRFFEDTFKFSKNEPDFFKPFFLTWAECSISDFVFLQKRTDHLIYLKILNQFSLEFIKNYRDGNGANLLIKAITAKCFAAAEILVFIAIPVNIEREYITRWGVARGENRDSSL